MCAEGDDMDFRKIDPATFKQEYEDYAKKMDRFMDGPTTTNFQQLLDAGD